MSSIARLETTYAYNKQKVVIDVADLMNTEGYYEAIAMSPDGRIEYEVMHTKDRQEALDAFELYKLRAQGGYPEGVYTKEQWHKDGSFNAFRVRRSAGRSTMKCWTFCRRCRFPSSCGAEALRASWWANPRAATARV